MVAARKFSIAELLPHRSPMMLLDELVDYDAEHVSCSLTIRPDTLFCESDRGVPSWVGIEYMAQTASTYSGILDASANRPAGICLLLGTRRYQAEKSYFPIGARLRINAELVLRDDNDLAAFDCTIDDGDAVIARGDIKAYRPKDIAAVVRGERI